MLPNGGDLFASHRVCPESSSLRASYYTPKCVHQSFIIMDYVSLGILDISIFLTVSSSSVDVMSSGSTFVRESWGSNTEQFGSSRSIS